MPNLESAKKALRQNKRRRLRNLKKREAIHALTKKVRKLLVAGNTEEAKTLLPQVYKAFDKAAKTGVIEKNTASRKKSRISRLVQKQKAAAVTAKT